MSLIISKLPIDWRDALGGFVPSKSIFAGGSIYTCEEKCQTANHPRNLPVLSPAVGILGATVMVRANVL
jgi:hypothetical protein